MLGILGGVLRLFWLLLAPMVVALLWASLSLNARRAHDRGKSAWWLLLYQGAPALLSALRLAVVQGGAPAGPSGLLALIGFCIEIGAFVDLGLLKGTAGPNPFGDDPLGPPIQEVFT